MSKTHQPNVLLEVASLSMRLSTKFVQPYSHPKSPQKFTQSQLLTILILKAYLKTTYRGIIDLLGASDQLRERMELTRLPHYSTLKYFADRSHVLEITDVTDIIICRHYRCGAVKAILHPEEAVELTKTKEWLAYAAETRAVIQQEHPGLEGEVLWDKVVERNVILQVKNLSKHPVVAAALAAGIVRLHGWALRFETSDALAYDPLANAFSPLVEMSVVHAILPAPKLTLCPPAEVGLPDAPPPPVNAADELGESARSDRWRPRSGLGDAVCQVPPCASASSEFL